MLKDLTSHMWWLFGERSVGGQRVGKNILKETDPALALYLTEE